VSLKEILKPIQEVTDYSALREEYERKPLASIISEVKEHYEKRGDIFKLKPVQLNGKRLYFIEFYNNGAFWPSYLSAYFYCAKNLWLRHYFSSTIVGERGLRGIARGLKVHELYIEYLKRHNAEVESEVHVSGEYCNVIVCGYVDMVVNGIPVEVKSGYNELLGHKLQLMLYSELMGVRHGYLVYPHKIVYVKVNSNLL